MSLVKNRLEQLRCWLRTNQATACIIPQSDPHLSEYIEEHDQIRAFFSGFTGSAGTLVVTLDKAGLWTDSRYYLQAEEQLQGSSIALFKAGMPDVPTYVDWLMQQVGDGVVVANAFLFSHNTWHEYAAKIRLVHASQFEACWENRPALSSRNCWLYKGLSIDAHQKIAQLRAALKESNADACFMTSLDDIAWLLNVRGGDVEYVPVVRSYLWVGQDELIWWVDTSKVADDAMQQYLSALSIKALPYDMVEDSLPNKTGECVVWVDAQQVNERVYQQLSMRYALLDKEDWCVSQKSCKTLAEIAGIQEAMQYDAVAWVRSLKWLDEQLSASVWVSELDFQQAMLHFKQQMPHYMGESFAPIVGYGSHGAIVHYEATAASNASLQASGFLLVDAGSHYRHGTTDATRTIACGSLSDLERKVYTLVLKGMIAVATCRFAEATPSSEIDALAREALRNHGFDYGHGTGHGVGIVLNVHEEGARLSPKSVKPLKEGMVLSDEPGCYLAGQFGVRIENMLAVQKDTNGELFFETLTYIPLQCSAIDKSLLTQTEIDWINEYHRRVEVVCLPYLTSDEISWFKKYAYEI